MVIVHSIMVDKAKNVVASHIIAVNVIAVDMRKKVVNHVVHAVVKAESHTTVARKNVTINK